MTEAKRIPDLPDRETRIKWFKENADYFSVTKFKGVGKFETYPMKDYDKAIQAAKMLADLKRGKWLVYAVVGESSEYLQTVG